jgi:hypothetical protein
MPNRKSYEYEIVIEDFDFDSCPLILPDGSRILANATVTVQFDASLDSWNYPDAANTRREEITIDDTQVSIDLDDIVAYDGDGNEIPATEELRQHLIASFPTDEFREEMCEEFESANDPWNSSDDDPRE